MVISHADLDSTIENVKKTMLSARQLRDAAALRSLTIYRPATHSAKRWYREVQMLRRFPKICVVVQEVSNAADGGFEMDRSQRFLSKVLRYNMMLAEIDSVTKSLQTRYHTFAKCRDDVDVLIKTEREERRKLVLHCMNWAHITSSLLPKSSQTHCR